MLTKLLKHEFRATARIMGPLYLVLLAVALGFNFSARLMDTSNVVLNILAALVIWPMWRPSSACSLWRSS